jgi:uncharacterized protein YcfL
MIFNMVEIFLSEKRGASHSRLGDGSMRSVYLFISILLIFVFLIGCSSESQNDELSSKKDEASVSSTKENPTTAIEYSEENSDTDSPFTSNNDSVSLEDMELLKVTLRRYW